MSATMDHDATQTPPPVIQPEIMEPSPESDVHSKFKRVIDRFRQTSTEQLKITIYRLPNYLNDRRTDRATERAYIKTIPWMEEIEDYVQRDFGAGAYSLDFRAAGKIAETGFLLIDSGHVETPAPVPNSVQPPKFDSQYREMAEGIAEIGKIYRDMSKAFSFNTAVAAEVKDPLSALAQTLEQAEQIKTLLGVTSAPATTANPLPGKTPWDVLADVLGGIMPMAQTALAHYLAKDEVVTSMPTTPEPIKAMQAPNTPANNPTPAPRENLFQIMTRVAQMIDAGSTAAQVADALNAIDDSMVRSQMQTLKNAPMMIVKSYLGSYPAFKNFLGQGESAVKFLVDVQNLIQ